MRVFVFQLALALGKTVRELEENMDNAELMEWLTVSAHYLPLPNPWLQTGVQCAANANYSGNIKRAVSERQFMPVSKPKQEDWRLQRAKMQAYALKHPMR